MVTYFEAARLNLVLGLDSSLLGPRIAQKFKIHKNLSFLYVILLDQTYNLMGVRY